MHIFVNPQSALLSFFKMHGRLCMSSTADLQSKALSLVVRGRTLLEHNALTAEDARAQMERADQVSSLCAEALYAAGGFGAVATASAFASEEALAVLEEGLDLSPTMADPLRQLRGRVIALASGGEAHPLDAFVAFQATALAAALIEWTADLLSHTLAGPGVPPSAISHHHA
jgi:hypothetical protein